MVHGKETEGNTPQGRAAKGRYRGLGGSAALQKKQTQGAGAPHAPANIIEIIKGVFSKFSRDELDAAVKAEKAYRKYAQKLSEKYHVHMKESRIAKLRTAHRHHDISEEQYHKELKILMKARPGDLDIIEEINFA